MAAKKVMKNEFGYRTSPVVGLAAGYKIDNMFRVELNARMRGKTSKTVTTGPDSETSKWQSWSLLVNGIYDVNINNSTFTPYVMAGIGYGHDKVTDTEKVGTVTTTDKYKKNQFIYNVGFGTRVHVAKQVDLDFGYRFVGRASNKLKDAAGHKREGLGLNTHELVAGVMVWF
jgi:opacity protein-like surface antigen